MSEEKVIKSNFQPVVMASSDDVASEPLAVVSKGEIKLDKGDMEDITSKIRAEEGSLRQLAEVELAIHRMKEQREASIKGVHEAREARNKACLDIEEKYKIIKGASWVVDFEKGVVVVRPKAAGRPQG